MGKLVGAGATSHPVLPSTLTHILSAGGVERKADAEAEDRDPRRGPRGLAAAVRLTEADPDRYDITIYQMGWRVGGKGTSGYRRWLPPGSNVPVWNRIEEHGLHILFGFYDEFWAVIRRCYEELGRPSQHPWRRWRRPSSRVCSAARCTGIARAGSR